MSVDILVFDGDGIGPEIMSSTIAIIELLNAKLKLNINLKKYKILVVKSGYLSPELKKLKADNFMILTDGFVTQDFKRIKNLFREKPIYPFQKNFRYNIAI